MYFVRDETEVNLRFGERKKSNVGAFLFSVFFCFFEINSSKYGLPVIAKAELNSLLGYLVTTYCTFPCSHLGTNCEQSCHEL